MKIKESKETVKIKTGSLLMLVGRSLWRKNKNKRKIKTKEMEKKREKREDSKDLPANSKMSFDEPRGWGECIDFRR